jgi:hypothetical protein
VKMSYPFIHTGAFTDELGFRKEVREMRFKSGELISAEKMNKLVEKVEELEKKIIELEDVVEHLKVKLGIRIKGE